MLQLQSYNFVDNAQKLPGMTETCDYNRISLCLAFSPTVLEERRMSTYNYRFKSTSRRHFTSFSEKEIDQYAALVLKSDSRSRIVAISKVFEAHK